MLFAWVKKLLGIQNDSRTEASPPSSTSQQDLGFLETAEYTATDRSGTFRGPLSRTLDAIAQCADQTEGVRKGDLKPGDWVLVKTKNSTYSICALGGDEYSVSGGWFDREGISPQKVRIDGCTWGGNAIKSDLVAARGLFLGFGNSVTTTRIKDFQVFHSDDLSTVV